MKMPKEMLDPELQQLISVGKTRGYVTYHEMNAALPTDGLTADALDDMMVLLSDMSIEVVEQASSLSTPAKPKETPAAVAREAVRSSDPVRFYLKRMGKVRLLSRAGEVAIAKRIEEGQATLQRRTLTSPIALVVLERLVENETRQAQDAQARGRKFKPFSTSKGEGYSDVLTTASGLSKQLSSLRAEHARAKSKKRKQHYEQQATETEDTLLRLMKSARIPTSELNEISKQIQTRGVWCLAVRRDRAGRRICASVRQDPPRKVRRDPMTAVSL